MINVNDAAGHNADTGYSISLAQLARVTRLSTKTIGRYVKQGWLRPRRVRIGGYLRYDFAPGSIDQVRRIRQQKRRHLEAVSPALARHLAVRLGEGPLRVGIAAAMGQGRHETDFQVGQQPGQQVKCPKCGYLHWPGAW